jgi:pyridoxal phosphate-dependent aminotransferase EpsN
LTAVPRIYLSPPDLSGAELDMLRDAVESNWIAPLGPHVDAFEAETAARMKLPCALALSSGTAGLHLALEVLGVEAGDEVWCSTLTFAATAFAVHYVGATPVFVDSEPASWNMDPGLLAEALDRAAHAGKLPKAIIVVDLYGQCADLEPIVMACRRHGVYVIEDAAEALGATYRGEPPGALADLTILSFNGNKIITTSGGGMLLGHRKDWIDRARYLATQARSPVRHYEHEAIGHNYRMSNLLAAVGRAQLADLDRRVAARRATNAAYRRELGDLAGWRFMPEAPGRMSTFWLTCAVLDAKARADRDRVIDVLAAAEIESRPIWKPMHLQPVFAGARVLGGRVSEELFARGLCLPSGSNLRDQDRARVVEIVRGISA